MNPEQKKLLYQAAIQTPVGDLTCISSELGVRYLLFNNDDFLVGFKLNNNLVQQENELNVEVKKQMNEYFAGIRKKFDLPIDNQGSPFQQLVWEKLQLLNYGETYTYGNLATALGDVKKIRAVANANAQNKILILIPCHRIIGAGNKLTGYRGGLERKKWLLNFERENFHPVIKSTLF